MAELRYLHASSGGANESLPVEPYAAPEPQRPDLRVLPSPTRDRSRWRRLIAFALFIVVLSSLGAIVVARAEMAATESTLQRLDSAIVAAQARQASLQAIVASLTAPSRIVSYAEGQLHMVPASGARFVNGPDLSQSQGVASVPAAPGGAPYPAGSQVTSTSQSQSALTAGSSQGG
ncbi:MAG: hypothetical protein ACP5O0_07370 [Acidimicrobiales bacterium]